VKLKKLVLEAALPREVQPTSTTWTQVIPSAQYTSDGYELDYDPATALVRIKSPYSLRYVHVGRVLFMELAEAEPEPILKSYAADMGIAQAAAMPSLESIAPKRRGMPKGGWPKKVPEAPSE
jgi:hypothetical protein